MEQIEKTGAQLIITILVAFLFTSLIFMAVNA